MERVRSSMVTTAFELPGCRIVKNLGVVRGIVVRSRSIIGNIGAAVQTLFGGNITLYTELCEKARADAYELMLEHASERGANAIIAVRYDANEVASGVTEVLAYGTAVVVTRAERDRESMEGEAEPERKSESDRGGETEDSFFER
jgi:uncharacterized protein YbjQ (UPF0145 family)